MIAMYGAHEAIELHLTQLRSLLSCDFAGLAYAENQLVRWKIVSGNRNDRYKKIVLRSGKGIAGQVLRSGRPMTVDSLQNNAHIEIKDFPIMLAENLVSAVAVPLSINTKVVGVLLIGSRSPRSYFTQDIELMNNFAEQLGSMIQARKETSALQLVKKAFVIDLDKEDLK